MVKLKKKEILNTIKSLLEINNTIRNSNNLNIEAAQNTLVQCQEAAITIGNCLEQRYNGCNDIVAELERYCEALYELNQNINDEFARSRTGKKINKMLLHTDNMISYVLPEDKKEVVFLPYKASMWDSLESVWKKMSEDENCITYVIPIPYFDKNEDGSLGAMHYEGNEYPDYVPITSYEEYNIAEHRPDTIYIHNPYDGYNRVTSVHPDYYSKKLRQYTDELVYIPYFVALNDEVERHFCTTSGVFFAHKVIVQSERTREIYIEELRKYEQENNCMGVLGNIEEKIVAGGSPKFDKVMSAKREDYELPDAWQKLIIKPDGSRKKVILYNTTIATMLVDANKVITKIQKVFDTFRGNPEVVLLWRPHPLLKTTLKNMRSEEYDRYCQMEKTYIEEGYGIYDDTADMYMAIATSDAYYGDWSSLVELYKKTGKIIMIENIDL